MIFSVSINFQLTKKNKCLNYGIQEIHFFRSSSGDFIAFKDQLGLSKIGFMVAKGGSFLLESPKYLVNNKQKFISVKRNYKLK